MGSKNIDNKLVKSAYVTQKFTEKDIEDLLKCNDLQTGPHYFLENFFYIQHPVKGKMQYTPFEYQRRLIDSYNKHRFNVNLLPRQTGKCLKGDTSMINIRNKKTGEIREISIQEFFELQKNSKRE